jgi:hypothetical protein
MLSLMLCPIAVLATDEVKMDEQAVRETVEKAYVHGVHIEADPDLMRAGFDERFVMFVQGDAGVTQVTRDEWIARIEKSRSEKPGAKRPQVAYRFREVDITGNAALVKIEIDRDGKHVFTDYLSLYRTENGWKIVGKIYQSHP